MKKLKRSLILMLLLMMTLISSAFAEEFIPLYRVYNRVSGEHLYTPSTEEVSVLTSGDWNDEGIGWHSKKTGDPVYRLYNPVLNNHLYTTDNNEVKELTQNDIWVQDFSGSPLFFSEGSIPVYRLYNRELRGEHLLTTDLNEYNTLPSYGWKQEGIALYALNPDELDNNQNTNTPSQTSLTLSVDQPYFMVNNNGVATFTAIPDNKVSEDIILYQDGTQIGAMHDDGLDGDSKAGDNIYSYQLNVNEPSETVLSFSAKTGNNQSNNVDLRIFNTITNTETQEADDINNDLSEVVNPYLDEEGYVKNEQLPELLNEVEEFFENLRSSGRTIEYSHDGLYYSAKLTSGIRICYSPSIKELASGGSNVQMQIHGLFPARDTMNAFAKPGYDAVINTVRKIPGVFNNYHYSESSSAGDSSDDRYENWEVSYDVMKNISGPNQLFLFTGHGGWINDQIGSTLILGEDFDKNRAATDGQLAQDLISDAVVDNLRVEEDGNCKYAITANFIRKYYRNLANSLVYLACCESCRATQLPNAFLSAGASAVVGSSKEIIITYCNDVQNEVLNNLISKNPDTNEYYTLKEALQKAKKDKGENDSLPRQIGSFGLSQYFDVPAEVKIVTSQENGENYRLDNPSSVSDGYGTVNGKVNFVDSLSLFPVGEVTLTQNNNIVGRSSLGSDGSYFIQAPSGKYTLKASFSGYKDFITEVTVPENDVLYMEDINLVSDKEGNGLVRGRVLDAINNQALSDAKVTVRSKWNDPDSSVITSMNSDTNGDFYFELPIGYYTFTAEKDGYILSSINVSCSSNGSSDNNISISPVLPEGQFRFVLTWGQNPDDLDSHLEGIKSDGDYFHTWFRNHNDYVNGEVFSNLDVDDTSSYGPETITLKEDSGFPYDYYVVHYAGSGLLTSSEAQVKVFKGSELVATYNVPTTLNCESNWVWNVCTIQNGQVIPKNTITAQPSLSNSANAQGIVQPSEIAFSEENTDK